MAIRADRRDYKNAFIKHFHAYSNWQNVGSDISKRLILIYCVECGLKYLIMVNKRIFKVAEAQPDIKEELGSHDFRRLLRCLNQAGIYTFQTIETKHGDCIRPDTYHQLCRYSICPIEDHKVRILQNDAQLLKIVEWIREQV